MGLGDLEGIKDRVKELEGKVKKLEKEEDWIGNNLKAVENWVEKYEPLRVQHQISETLNQCLDRKAKAKLVEYDKKVCMDLRDTIFHDAGSPSIQTKLQDIFTELSSQ